MILENDDIVLRTEVDLLGPDTPTQAFHAAAGLPLDEARRLVDGAKADVLAAARSALAAVGAGRELVSCGVIVGNNPLPTSLEKVLGAHVLMHAAEGVMFRDALIEAAEAAGLAVSTIGARDADDMAVGLSERITEWGRQVGKPWRKEHKLAAVAAWLATA